MENLALPALEVDNRSASPLIFSMLA